MNDSAPNYALAFITVDGVEAKIVHYQEENAESNT